MSQHPRLKRFTKRSILALFICGGVGAVAYVATDRGYSHANSTVAEQQVTSGNPEEDLENVCSPKHSLLMAGEMVPGSSINVHFVTPPGNHDRSIIVSLHCGIPEELSKQISARIKDPSLKEGMIVYHPGPRMGSVAPDLWVTQDKMTAFYCNDEVLEKHGVGKCEVTVRLSSQSNATTGLFLLGTYGIDPPNRSLIPAVNEGLVKYFLARAGSIRQEVDSKLP